MVSKKKPVSPIPLKRIEQLENEILSEIMMSDPEYRTYVESSDYNRTQSHPHFSDEINDYEHAVDDATINRVASGDLTRWRVIDEILTAIVRAHPVKNQKTEEERLSAAKDALQGAERRRPYHPDDDALRAIASEWAIKMILSDLPDGKDFKPPFEPLVKAVADEKYWAGLNRDERNKIIKRLKGKFNRRRDVLLAERTAYFHPEQRKREALVNEIIERLVELGLAKQQN